MPLSAQALAAWAKRFFDLGASGGAPARALDGAPAALVFDVETDGGRGGQLAVQIAWVVYNAGGEELFARCEYLALPPGRTISYFATKVHRISNAMLREKGMRPQHVLVDFFTWADRVAANSGAVVAHNAAFDARLLEQTAERHGVREWDIEKRDVLCTMQMAKPYTNLVSKKTGKPKAPGNVELYRYLHKRSPQLGALHDALVDVKVTAACYAAGRDRGWWR